MLPPEIILKSSLAAAVILASVALGWRCLRGRGSSSRNNGADPASQRRLVQDLAALDGSHYHFYPHIQLPSGTSPLDGVIVSPYGIFVVLTLSLRGWIQGHEKELNWTVQFGDEPSFLTNPILQVESQAHTLARILSLPRHLIHPVVYLTGDAAFRSRHPEGVIDRDLVSWIMRRTEVVFTEAQRHRICYHLDFRYQQSLQTSHRPTSPASIPSAPAA